MGDAEGHTTSEAALAEVSRYGGDEKHRSRFEEGLRAANRQALLAMSIAGTIHEINNPTNNILLASRLLSDCWSGIVPLLEEHRRLDPQATCAGMPYAALIETVPRILTMIADDVGRINHSVTTMKSLTVAPEASRCAVDVNAAVASAVEVLKGTITRRSHAFRLDLAEGLPGVLADVTGVRQVVINLVCNALQSLPDRNRPVTVATAADQGGAQVLITVADEGSGIRPDDLPYVFEPFFTTRSEQGCAGLGLSVSRLIIEGLGGTLELASQWGRGSRVTVRLPRV